MALVDKLRETLCNPLRDRGARCVRGNTSGIGGELHLDARIRPLIGAVDATRVARRGKRHERSAEYTRLTEHAVDEREHIDMASEIVSKLDKARFVSVCHRGKVPVVDRDVRPAEAIDALLRIADRAQALEVLARHALHHVHLQLVGILELVDHNQLEAIGVLRSDFGMLAEHARRHREQVVVVEHSRLMFAPAIRIEDAARQVDNLAHARLGKGKASFHHQGEIPLRRFGCELLVFRRAERATRNRKGIEQLQDLFRRWFLTLLLCGFEPLECTGRPVEERVAGLSRLLGLAHCRDVAR